MKDHRAKCVGKSVTGEDSEKYEGTSESLQTPDKSTSVTGSQKTVCNLELDKYDNSAIPHQFYNNCCHHWHAMGLVLMDLPKFAIWIIL